jgi:hypothetical protein
MEYALLAYGPAASTPGSMHETIAALLARPHVTGWARLYADESATTLRSAEGKTLLTDGPFIESKEYLVGLIIIEAEDLDRALAISRELQEATTGAGAIEVRPIFESWFRGA